MSAVPCLFCGDPAPFMSMVEGMCLKCGDNIQAQGMPFILRAMANYERERQRLELEVKMREATLSMAVARLGGEVEGKPTARVNFLQRIDQLVEAEFLLTVAVDQSNSQWAKREAAEAEVERLKQKMSTMVDRPLIVVGRV